MGNEESKPRSSEAQLSKAPNADTSELNALFKELSVGDVRENIKVR